MNLSPEEIRKLPMHVKVEMAMRAAVENVIAENKRLGLPLAVLRDGKVAWISAEEAEAEVAAEKAAAGR